MTGAKPKALISWSSGKDSAFALHEVRRAGEFEARLADADAVAQRLTVFLDEIEEAVGRIDDDGAGLLSGRILDDLAHVARLQVLHVDGRNRELVAVDRRVAADSSRIEDRRRFGERARRGAGGHKRQEQQ